MSRFNAYMSNHFGSCMLLAESYDPHRQRDVKIYRVPGEDAYVGVTDGTDSWIAPVVADLFTCNIKRIMDDLHAGKMPVISKSRERKKLPEQILPVSTTRKALPASFQKVRAP